MASLRGSRPLPLPLRPTVGEGRGRSEEVAQSSPGSTDQDMPQGNVDSHGASLIRGLEVSKSFSSSC